MSTKIFVEETSEQLRQLLQRYEGTRRSVRILMLLLFQEDSSTSIRAVSRKIGVPESTLRRWARIYTEGGIAALLGVKGGKSRVFSASTPTATVATTSILNTPVPGFVPVGLIELLNELPVTFDTKSWTRKFADVVSTVFHDVDYAIANIRITIDLINPSHNKTGPTYRQGFSRDGGQASFTMRRPESIEVPQWKLLVEDGRRHGFPLEKYQEPVGFDFFIEPDVFIGSLVLFRKKGSGEISSGTLELLERLRPFLTKIYLFHVAMHQLRRPADMAYADLLGAMINDADLTAREGEVLGLLVLGHSYDEASEALGVSKSTLLSHVRKIYRKANVAKLSELFARYLTPRFFSDKGKEEEESDDG